MDPTHKIQVPRPRPRRGEIAHVHIAKTGMLSAADAEGNDLPQFGGPSEETLPVILETCNPTISREE